jgi:hypothetical protein
MPDNINNSDDSCRKAQIPYSSGVQSDMSNNSDNNNRGSHLGSHPANDHYVMGAEPCQWYSGSHNSGSGISTGSRNMTNLPTDQHGNIDVRYQQLKNPLPRGKGPLLNLGDILPPPPEHPPPTDIESAAESTPPGSPRMEHPNRVLGGTIPANVSRPGFPATSYQHVRPQGNPGGLLGFVPSPRTNPRSMTIPQQNSDPNQPGPTPPVRHYKLIPIPNASDSPNASPVPQTVYLTQQSLPNCAPPANQVNSTIRGTMLKKNITN